MKTSWSVRYLEQKYGRHRRYNKLYLWKRDKQREFEAETGVKWTVWSVHGNVNFAPCWTRETPKCMDDAMLGKVMDALPRQASAMYAATFLKLAEATGLSLLDVVSVAKTLCRRGQAVPVVCRMAMPIAIYRARLLPLKRGRYALWRLYLVGRKVYEREIGFCVASTGDLGWSIGRAPFASVICRDIIRMANTVQELVLAARLEKGRIAGEARDV